MLIVYDDDGNDDDYYTTTTEEYWSFSGNKISCDIFQSMYIDLRYRNNGWQKEYLSTQYTYGNDWWLKSWYVLECTTKFCVCMYVYNIRTIILFII